LEECKKKKKKKMALKKDPKEGGQWRTPQPRGPSSGGKGKPMKSSQKGPIQRKGIRYLGDIK